MRLYTVHLRRHGLDPERDLVLVKEGFSWPAFLFTVLWALWHRQWLVAAVLLAVNVALTGIMELVGLDVLGQGVLSLAGAVVFGFVANDLRRWTLARRGFVETGVVVGPGRDEAERRFLADDPDLARAMRA